MLSVGRALSTLALCASISSVLATPAPVAEPQSPPPPQKSARAASGDKFQPSNAGGGGSNFIESPHFRIYNAPSQEKGRQALNMLEGANDCFVNGLKWRSSGIPFNSKSENPPVKYKANIYVTNGLGTATGIMSADAKSGLSFVKVVPRAVTDPFVTVHEYGHALTYHERNWVEQKRTGVWWEPVANWVAETFVNSPLCADARKRANFTTGAARLSRESVNRIFGNPHRTLVDGNPKEAGNYYESWPFLTYLTNNPDEIQ